jgi:hypothetical protein
MRKLISTKNQVIDALQWSTQEYEDRLFLSMWNWCQHYGQYPSVIQQLLANSQVNKWFLSEHEKCELQFLKITGVVAQKPEILAAHYKACTAQMMALFPKSLLDAVRRNKEFSNILITNTPVYYAN